MLEDYKVYIYTNKQLNRMYSKNLLDKYRNVLGYLYQNGFETDIDTIEEFEDQLSLWNNFKDGLDELRSYSKIKSEFEIGKHIVAEEFYEFSRRGSFCRNEADTVILAKTYATVNWENIKKITKDIEDFFNSKDSEIIGFLNSLLVYKELLDKLNKLKEKIDKDIKVYTWYLFSDIINIIYSVYIQYGKVRNGNNKISVATNLNTELYGAIGGYNPNTREIKSFIGGAVYNVKEMYALTNIQKLKAEGMTILKENKNCNDEPEHFRLVELFVMGQPVDIEKVKRVIVCSMLHGILGLLMLKHNLNSMKEDTQNKKRSENIRAEFTTIVNYCGIDTEYLL